MLINKDTYPVLDMSCAACASQVEKTLQTHKGVLSANVNFANNSVNIEFDQELTSLSELQQAVESVGYGLVVDTQLLNSTKIDKEHELKYLRLRKKTIWAILLALPVAIIGMFFMNMPYGNAIMWLLTTFIMFFLGNSFYINAWKQLKHRSSNMDTLVALSTGVAYVFSVFNSVYPEFWTSRGLETHVYYEAVAVVIAFILLGRLFEDKAKSNTSSAIKKLIGLQPNYVTLIDKNGNYQVTPIANVVEGNRILVRPGDRIAVDGEVLKGNSFIDESMLSGEPIPVEKEKGSFVYAGTINQKGSLEFIATKVGKETMLAQIIRMVQDAQGSKAPVQKLVDKIASIFVPIVIGVAVIAFITWIVFGGNTAFSQALLSMVTVLVIACPCALGLATPTAIMVGIGKGAENGILIKDAESLELAKKVNAVVLDKTGTITEGRPEVLSEKWSSNDDSLKCVLKALENQSEHPLAESVVKHYEDVLDEGVLVDNFKSLTGLGIQAVVNGITYFVGNQSLLEKENIKISEAMMLNGKSIEALGQTIIWFSDHEKVLAVLGVADKIKPSSITAIKTLHKLGIEIYMLTGDHEKAANTIAKEAGIVHYKAHVLPNEKELFIKELQANGKVVAMVGDGINDSAALARADVSIAMGKGSDIAIDVAKMTIISSDLNKIPMAIELSKQTVKTIKQNLFWAFIYNLIGIPIAAGVLYPINGFLLNPMIASAAMAMSSVSVVTNSLRLKFRKFLSVAKIDQSKVKPNIDYNMKVEYQVSDMMCGHCHARVKKALETIDGVVSVEIIAPSTVIVEQRDDIELELMQKELDAAGGYKISK